MCGVTVPYHGTLPILALHPCHPSPAVGELWGAWQLCGCKTPVPSSDQVPCMGNGACSPWLVAASPGHGACKEDPGSPALTVDGCSAGAPLSWLLSLLCNSTGCPPPCQERAVSGAVASICLIQSQVPLVPPSPRSPSSCGINCLKHFLDSRGGFCSLSPLFSIAACLELCLSGRAAVLDLPTPVHPRAVPFPASKDWSGSFPGLKITCQVRP